jgi:hypothetical protein
MLNFKMIIEKYNKLLNMKLQTIYILASVIMLMAFASCKKDLLKTNTDPNAVSVDVFDPNNILSATQLYYTGSTNNAIEVEETEFEGAGCFIQHFASLSFYGDKYLINNGAWSAFFDNVYPSAVKYAVDLYTTTSGKPQYKNLHQISRIMKALVFQRITDVYGDVPYSQAGLGYHNSVFFPAYDKQQDIYKDMLKEVSQAVDSLDENADKPVGDLFYSTSDDQIAEWKKFGNSFLLRLAMRLTKVDPATAQKYVKQVLGKTMTSNDDNAIVAHDTNDPLSINRLYRGIGEDGAVQLSLQVSDTFVAALKDDPRLPIYAFFWDPTWAPPLTPDNPPVGTADTSQIHGLPNGYDASTGPHGLPVSTPGFLANVNLYARINPLILNPTAPSLVLTYAETELLLADAAQRWGIVGTEDAGTAYNNGVTAAMSQLSVYGDGGTINGDDIMTYLGAHPYNPANGLNLINTQYWLTTFCDEYEAWSNFRRTGYPALKPVSGYPSSQSKGAIPHRMQYSTNDKQVNPTNYNAAVSRLTGGDKITSRVWWDVQ